ncbi:DEAD/DEAH box helicase [Leifsonia poae]|uniref:DEAD/DEAH box helicase n=1 Tax=Leifsonia poae TaxID=110933 RepID=UPI001CBB4C96|nr:DEAD/DEAH box helicase [Leifsonia poae]
MPEAARSIAGWKAGIAELSRPAAAARTAATTLGLQFELRERLSAPGGRWEAPKSRTVTASRAAATTNGGGGTLRLGVRPVTRSATGNWVRGSLTWTSLPHSLNRLGVGAEQHRWFVQFAALHRSVRDVYVPGDAEWLFLDDFASRLLWPLLAEGEQLGIALVSGKRETSVRLADNARVTIDVTAGETAELRLRPMTVIDDRAHPAGSVGAIDDHGVYAWEFSPEPRFTLAPTTAPLSTEQRRLLGAPDPIDVPAADAGEFLQHYYPRLRRIVEVVSSDDSVTFPEIVPPLLVLTASFAEGDLLDLDWAWETDGEREALPAHPLPADLDQTLGAPPQKKRLSGAAAADFAASVLPALERRSDLRVDVLGARPDYRELTETPRLVVTTVETDKRDWFDLGVLVTVEGRTIPFTPLFTALSKGRDKLLMVDKTYLSLKQPVFDELRLLIIEAGSLDEWETGRLRINRYQAHLWSEFEELADETRQAESWQRTMTGLRSIRAGETLDATPVPETIAATLRPYQVEGFRWLAFLWAHALGGVLADDMGLGKTLQTLALLDHVRETTPAPDRRPFLVVAPTSVVANWAAEAARFAPRLRVTTLTTTLAKGRTTLSDLAAGADVIITSYALFRLDAVAYRAREWAGLILDEAQLIKNRRSKAHQAAVELSTPFKLAITGTPLENDLMDVWSIFHVVSPGLLPSGVRFGDQYLKPLAAGERPDLIRRLRDRVRPLLLRRTKEAVASELPEKQEQVLRVDLAPRHRALYDRFLQRERQKLLGLVEDLDRNRFIVFRSLTLLRMLALDASLLDEQYSDIPSAKLDVLLDELDEVIAGGHRALIFSQFTSLLGRLRARLDERGIRYDYLDGTTRRRPEVIRRFKEGTAPAFLISLKAGGFGLTLTEADYVFLLDPWWNPATEAQAIDRTHRIGQTANVMVYRMIATDTIEEKVLALQDRKARLFDALMDDENAALGAALTADDIRGLLDD